jgi:hypothetical protein
VIRQRRARERLVSIENIETMSGGDQGELAAGQSEALERLSTLIRRLKPLDRQIIISYLEGMDASSVSEITGLSPANVAMKIHRIKNVLRRWFGQGGFMPSEFPVHDPQNIWQSQNTEPFKMPAAELRLKVQQHQKKAWLKAHLSIIIGLVLFVFFAWTFAKGGDVVPRMGLGLLSLWCLYSHIRRTGGFGRGG